ncbi:hypothetical protein LAV72_19290 [Lysinibacillus xylanilyticus]|uniref:hypothetical protein n=1 Tax=Lysinibacillus xylanilyticus TaxID=582475 RepID=UPI002B24F6FA|nr:hypothetical protein [Lysinibacillus xylanilyticus]MEB2301752.1 hypothetical protein [Lysinibacillus xylanilyticus]
MVTQLPIMLDIYGTATGTNTLTMSHNAVTSYYDGMLVAFKNTTNNTGACTLNINSLGAKPILKNGGAALSAGNLKAGGIYTLRYNATANSGNGAFILQGESEVEIGKQIITPKTVSQWILKGVHDGTGYVEGSPNLLPQNIAKDVNIFGVVGTAFTPPPFLYGTTVIAGSYVLSQTSRNTWTIVKSFSPKFTGQITMVFDLYRYGGDGSNETMYAQVRNNGVVVGQIQYTTYSSANTFFSIDMDVKQGDNIALYTMSQSEYAYATNSVVLLCVAGTSPIATFNNY